MRRAALDHLQFLEVMTSTLWKVPQRRQERVNPSAVRREPSNLRRRALQRIGPGALAPSPRNREFCRP